MATLTKQTAAQWERGAQSQRPATGEDEQQPANADTEKPGQTYNDDAQYVSADHIGKRGQSKPRGQRRRGKFL